MPNTNPPRLTPDEVLWVSFLEKDRLFQDLSPDDVRDELRLGRFPERVIDAVLARRAA